MIKLELPNDCHNYSEILNSCCRNMNESNALYNKLKDNKSNLIIICSWNLYIKYVLKNEIFYTFNLCNLLNSMPDLVSIRNHEMMDLYTQYFSKKGTHARKFYEKIINNAKNPKIQCPFCGGIGEPNELDHFLPKSKFGYYSIFPYNLIPICKDCNQKYKKEFYPKERNQQLIHPYLDDDCFFDEQWLFANIIIDFDDITLSTVKFYANPPHHWSDDKKGKIQFHFDMFDLKKRYTIKSSLELSQVIRQIQEFKANGKLNEIDILACLISPVILDNRVNNWKKVLYEAIKQKFSSIWNSI